ncbi:hypothetical protein NKDENANG_01915 [Candidatus Entotheonellaceae bacterium PAL068K]
MPGQIGSDINPRQSLEIKALLLVISMDAELLESGMDLRLAEALRLEKIGHKLTVLQHKGR